MDQIKALLGLLLMIVALAAMIVVSYQCRRAMCEAAGGTHCAEAALMGRR